MYENLLSGSSIGSQWDLSGMSFEMYRKYVSDLSGTKNNKTLLPHVINDLKALIEHLEKVAETNKYDYRLYITTAFLRSTLTYYTDEPYTQTLASAQLSTLEQAKNLAPTNPNVYWGMAQVKVWIGDFKGAEEAYREGIRVAPYLPASYNLALKYGQVIDNKKLFNELMLQAKENIIGYELK
jgi:tetratricopeptide (TPR) repeat protein